MHVTGVVTVCNRGGRSAEAGQTAARNSGPEGTTRVPQTSSSCSRGGTWTDSQVCTASVVYRFTVIGHFFITVLTFGLFYSHKLFYFHTEHSPMAQTSVNQSVSILFYVCSQQARCVHSKVIIIIINSS